MKNPILHMENPASEWENATPVGNGSMGAMLFGGVSHERIYLNEETIWSGGVRDTTAPDFREKIERVRALFLEGKCAQADEWAEENMQDCMKRVCSYESAGVLTVDFDTSGKAANYRRDLNVRDGTAHNSFTVRGVEYERESFASYPERLIVWRVCSSEPMKLEIGFERPNTRKVCASDGVLRAVCSTDFGDNSFCVAVRVKTDGETKCLERTMAVENASFCELYISIETSFRGVDFEEKAVERVSRTFDYDSVKAEHIADFSALSERSDISLDTDPALDSVPIAKRLKRLRSDEKRDDWGLVEIYFNFGKYLLISSSREGTLPANLQGVWAEKLENPWNADYHTNINLQMNYWHAEAANISECTAPLFDYMNNFLLESGKRTAEINYGVRGTVLHHLSDIYGFTTPADGLWGIWPLGGAWLAYHMWEHYLFTLDKAFLADTAYEYISQSARFFLDYMFEDGEGRLLSGPSASPENKYFVGEGKKRCSVYLCISPTMDVEIIGALLRLYVRTEEILGKDSEMLREAKEALEKMPPLRVGKHGQLMEWLEDYDEPEPGHRHISHAFALYPDCAINADTPELFRAIRVSIERRLSFGGGHTGWSRAWLVSLFARLGDGDEAYGNLKKLFTKSTNDNLFDTHPPFQIDGNFGGAAGIIEMLLQSISGRISLLPAVPEGMADGSFTGLCARGGITVCAEWRNARVTSLTLKAERETEVEVEYPSQEGRKRVKLTAPCTVTLADG